MALDPVSGSEVDRAALQRLRDALGAEALSMLAGECVSDLTQICAQLSEPTVDADMARRLAHKMAGLLGQYACSSASAFARDLAHGAPGAALAARKRLIERGCDCAAELKSLAGSP